MADRFEIKSNDLRPRYRVQLTSADADNPRIQVPVDLTEATGAFFNMRTADVRPVIKISRQPMNFIDRATGIVEYMWDEGDTDTAGKFNAEVEISWDGEPQTYPSYGFFSILIYGDIA